MAYQVIARKYRPQAFSELVGQKHVTQTLQNALASDRFPHAILFNGPRGTGKTTSARIIAKILLCENLKDQTPCQECKSCTDVQSGRHLDLYEIDGASNNGVDDIRELRDTIGYMPTSGKFKIYIIDEVHMLSTSAFNALLKTLEEPPAHVIFMFATTEVQKIPATILSRCQRFDLRMLSLNEIKGHLAEICTAESITFEDAALWMLAKQAKGSIRDSLTLLDQVISFGQNQLSQQTVMDVLGLSDRALLFCGLRAIAEQDKDAMLQTTQSLVDSGYDPLLFLEEFMEILRHALMVRAGVHKKRPLEIPENEVEDLEKMVVHFQEEEIQFLFDITLHGTQMIARSRDIPTAFEMHMFKLLLAPKLSSVQDVQPSPVTAPAEQSKHTAQTPAQDIPHSNRSSQNSPQPGIDSKKMARSVEAIAPPQTNKSPQTPSPQTATPAPSQPATPEEKTWDNFVRKVKTSNGFLGALLEHTSLYKETEEVLTLGLPQKMSFLLDKLQDPKNIERTQKFLQTFWQDSRTLEIDVLGKKEAVQALSPKAKAEHQKQEKAAKDKDSIESHPLVQATKTIFPGKITHVIESNGRTP